jgi:purine-binding chemotaxis protein CheW
MPTTVPDAGRWCSFRIGGDCFAVDSASVVEVVRGRRLTRVPLAGASVLGLVHMRGRIVPVIDPASRLGVSRAGRSAATYLVITLGEDWYGLAVDEVLDVIDIPEARIEPTIVAGGLVEAVRGIFAAPERLVHLLDPEGMIHSLVRQPQPSISGGGSHGGIG